ncbi:MAG: glycosyltransferase family 2 protein [Anaerolineaceae bacterium]
MTQKPTCSIIIRAYNEEKYIRRLLVGIAEQTVKNVQIILVDSGSTDRTIDETKEFSVEVVTIQPHEFTFGHSLNVGIECAKADLIVMASAHVFPVYPDWLETLLAPFSDKNVALTYGMQRGAETSHFSEQLIFQTWYPEHSVLQQPFPFCNNANAAIRRSLWQLHPYNENLPGLEDLAWAKWAQDNGSSIHYVAEAEVVHVHNESTAGIFNRYRREGMAFKQIYPDEKFTRRDLIKLFIQNVLSDGREALKAKRYLSTIGKIIRFRWLQFSGTYHGYKQSGPLTWQLKKAFYYPGNSVQQKSRVRKVQPIQYN